MTKKEKTAINKAIAAINKSWRRCDDESGKECRGLKCPDGNHRAVALLLLIKGEKCN